MHPDASKRLLLAAKILSIISLAGFSAPQLAAQSLLPGMTFPALAPWQVENSDPHLQLHSEARADSSSSSIVGQTGQPDDGSQGKQTQRILGVVPNFQAVSADIHLAPLDLKQKFWLATKNSFDYSSFLFVGIQAGVEEATNTYPEFHHGAAAFGRYYWHTFADQALGNYLTGAIFPAITREDPRYYTLYHGGFWRRTEYAMSRIVITRNDAGDSTFNFSEILGNGTATAVGGYYYPSQERGGAGETLERWATQLLTDAVGNVFEEFWPDINHKFFHER